MVARSSVVLGELAKGGWEERRGRQPAAITAGPVSSATIIAGSLPVYLRALPSAFLLLTVASPLRLCKGYALARRVEQRVGSLCLSGVSKRAAPRFRGSEWNRATILSRGYSQWEKYSLKCWEESNWNGETTVTRLKDSSRARERICIYIYVYLRDTSYDGRFVETMAGEQRIGYIDVRFIIAVKFRRRERLISLCERSSPILRDEMISLIAFSYIYIYIYVSSAKIKFKDRS